METKEGITLDEKINDNRCRICLKNTKVMVSLQDFANSKELTYWDILLQFCEFETENEINAPQSICIDCVRNTENCYEFKMLCEKSDKILKDELNEDITKDDFSESNEMEFEDNFKVEFSDAEVDFGTEQKNPIEEDFISKINQVIDKVSKKVVENVESIIIKETPVCSKKQKYDKHKLKDDDLKNYRNADKNKHNDDELKNNRNTTKHKLNDDGLKNNRNADKSKLNDDDSKNKYNLHNVDSKIFHCELCDIKFHNESVYKEHMTLRHSGSKTDFVWTKPTNKSDRNKKCYHCGEIFRRSSLTEHMLQAHKEKKIGCLYCDEHFFQVDRLLRHMKLEHPGKDNVCVLCEFKTSVHELYYEHMKENHKDAFQHITCEFCDFTTVSFILLGKHVARDHEGKKTFKCQFCDKSFFRMPARHMHEKTHLDEVSRYYCEVCGKSYKHKRDLTIHQAVHNNDKTLECNICHKVFNQFMNYKQHRLAHSDERNFKCDICGNTFKRKKDLVGHVNFVHNKIKAKECTVCSKKFSTSNGLRVHMLRHRGTKGIQCEICEKTFLLNWELTQHMVVHTGERRFVCEVCGKGFTQAQVLRGHMKTHNK